MRRSPQREWDWISLAMLAIATLVMVWAVASCAARAKERPMRTQLVNLQHSAMDQYDRLKPRLVFALLQGYYVMDGDTIAVLRDVGDSRFSFSSLRVNGVDTPETHTTDDNEKTAGLMVREVVMRWMDSTPLDEITIVEHPGGKYRGRFMGDVELFGASLSHQLLKLKLAYPYDGGTKSPWTTRTLGNARRVAGEILAKPWQPLRDFTWALPAIEDFRLRIVARTC